MKGISIFKLIFHLFKEFYWKYTFDMLLIEHFLVKIFFSITKFNFYNVSF